MSFAITHLAGFGAYTEGGVLTSAFTHSASTGASATPSYASCAIGTASADRLVIVVAGGSNGSTAFLSSVTIDGVSATVHASSNAAGGQESIGIASALVTSNTSVTIDVVWSASRSLNSINVWTLTGYSSSTPYASYAIATGSGTTFSTNLNVVAGGILFLGAIQGANNTATWTPAVEDSDFQVNAGAARASGARLNVTSTSTGYAETVTFSGSTHGGIAAAIWQ